MHSSIQRCTFLNENVKMKQKKNMAKQRKKSKKVVRFETKKKNLPNRLAFLLFITLL